MEEYKDQKQYSAEQIMKLLSEKKSDFWVEEGRKRSLALFHEAAQRVPAYKDFLKKNNVDPKKIKTWEDFQTHVPVMSKKNYLRQYPLEKLCWDGSLKKPFVFTATSGSTGEPFYFPRQQQLDWQYSFIAESFLQNSSYGQKGPILVIVGFGMGVWIGGLITYKAFEIAGIRGNLPISIITPGVNKSEIIKALLNLAPKYEQTILTGYPPFLKDIIDSAHNKGVNFKKINLRLFSAAEAFTESFRDYLAKKTKSKNLHRDTLSIYGSADIGAMASETPTAILIRRLVINNKHLFDDIFGQIQKTPTLAQYNPLFIDFKGLDGEVFLTGDNAIPLVRYAIGDNGGTLTFAEIEKKLKNNNIDLKKEAIKADIKICELPFVYVYERNDFSTTLYGLQIYPEFIKEALISKKLNKFTTGKFTMVTRYDKNQNQYLEINIELQKNKKSSNSFYDTALKEITDKLKIKSSEFSELSNHVKDKPLLKTIFWPYEDPLYFKLGIKQKWVKK